MSKFLKAAYDDETNGIYLQLSSKRASAPFGSQYICWFKRSKIYLKGENNFFK